MKLPSTPTQKNINNVVNLILQMSLAVLLFAIFFILSADGKPAIEADPVCGYESCPVADSDTLNVHLIPHSHDDVGWLKTPDQYFYQDVEYIISSVVDALKQNPERRYVQVETAFFKKWWAQQNDIIKQAVQTLVDNGQLEFINAAWSMNDEAAVHYQSTIDQFTLGLRYIQDNLGQCARPKVGWQIDPFGHSREQASLAALLGFDSIFFARLDYRDKNRRLDDKTMDLLWRGSANLGNSSDIFTSVLYRHYSAPPGFCFDIVCNDEVIIDDEDSPDYNLETRVQQFADFVREQAMHYPSNNILVTMGDDFRYEAAMTTFLNLDRLITGFQQFEQTYDGKAIRVFYSTPSCYTKAVNEYVNSNNVTLELKTDDFFPYADSPDTYWTGYFTSRPASKNFERRGSNLLQVAKQLAANDQQPYNNAQINSLKEAVGVLQHHDAITGTEKQHVADNYHLILSQALKNGNDAAGEIISRLISGNTENFNFDSCLLANVSSCAPSQTNQFSVAVYNPLSHATTTVVTLPVEYTTWSVLDPDGNAVAYQVDNSITDFSYVEGVTTSEQTLSFAALNLPPQGFKVYRFEATLKEEIENKNEESPRATVGFPDTNFEINDATGLLQAVVMNGIRVEVSQDFLYYESQNSSGAYIFVPVSQEPTRIASGNVATTYISGDVYEGVVQEFGSWAKQIIKVYNDDRNFIEFDWIIGSIDISDDVGKEVISRFTTNLATEGTFYTDAYGREILQRVKDYRPDYQYSDEQPVSGNYYPVNTRILIRDESRGVELALITDRSEGGSSINDGEIELMVHRACQHDDGRGVGENLNEQEFGQGIKVRGKHYLVVGNRTTGNGLKSLPAIERDVAQRKSVSPWVFVSPEVISGNLQFSGLRRALTDNVNILTLEPWDDQTLLLRLEHILENDEDPNLSRPVTIDVSQLFTLFYITQLKETTLGANMLIEESNRLHWPGSEAKEEKTVRDVDDLTVNLSPMQIRTFLATVIYT